MLMVGDRQKREKSSTKSRSLRVQLVQGNKTRPLPFQNNASMQIGKSKEENDKNAETHASISKLHNCWATWIAG
jgi:hypothetical protein